MLSPFDFMTCGSVGFVEDLTKSMFFINPTVIFLSINMVFAFKIDPRMFSFDSSGNAFVNAYSTDSMSIDVGKIRESDNAGGCCGNGVVISFWVTETAF